MANYDGPISITFAPPGFSIDYVNAHELPYFTEQPDYGSVPAYGSGGVSSTPSGQDINGYGYSHTG
jgi:hypothetical protein